MKTIVAPTDFSPISLNAVNYAADLACAIDAQLSVLHVCVNPVEVSEIAVPAYGALDLINDAEERMGKLKFDIEMRTRGQIKIYTQVAKGDIMTLIDRHCKAIHPYAVVMGAEGGGSFERFLFGGNTISAVKKLTWPVMVIPPGITFSGIRKVGLACDLNNVIHTVNFGEIKNLVSAFKASLHILHVRPDDGSIYTAEVKEESTALQKAFEDLKPLYYYLRDKNIDERICEFAEKHQLDLLIIIPKDHDLIERIFKHSHSEKIVLHTQVPLMAIHE